MSATLKRYTMMARRGRLAAPSAGQLPLLLVVLLALATTLCKPQEADDVIVDRKPGAAHHQQEASSGQPLEARPERVTAIAPKYLRPHSDYHVLVQLANSQPPATIDLQLIGAPGSSGEHSEARSVLVNSGETQTVKFTIGDWPPAEYTLSMNVQAVDRSWNFSQDTQLVYQPKSFSGLIQTDKAIYKPGQLVQFRALFLTSTLVPLPLDNAINVSVTDPDRNIIKQWQRVSNYRGLLTLELQLSDDPMLGDYLIQVEARGQQFSKQFTVAEYILPTFDVHIQLPSYATYNESDIVATVRASYTYGKPVSGHVTLTVQPLVRFAQLDTPPLHQAQFRARLANGSADFTVDVVKDLKQERDLFEREIEFFALVEEDLTGRKYNKTQIIKVHDKNVKIESTNPGQTFKPGLEHTIQLKVAYQDDTPVEDNGPEVELKYGPFGRPMNSTKLRPVGGIIEHHFHVPSKVPLGQSDDLFAPPSYIELQAIYRGHTHYLESIRPYTSQSQQYMQISLPQLKGNRVGARRRGPRSVLNVDDELKVRIQATEAMQQVTCQALARGNIIWATSPDAKNKTEIEFEAKIDQRMAPKSSILCFYVRPDNKEIIADYVELSVGGLMHNFVKLSPSRNEAKPGQEVEVSVFTKPNSLVGVLGIDTSVLLLKSGNDLSQKQVEDEIKSYGSSGDGDSGWRWARNAESLFESADMVVLTNNLVYNGFGYRQGRLLYMNMVVRQKPMQYEKSIALDSMILEHDISPPEFHLGKRKSSEPLVIRSFFPETWMWQNGTTGADGLASFKAKVPDTITSWQLSAFSMNEAHGLGLSDGSTMVRVFRPFFIKLNLPYSIIRGETVSIQAIVFNYSKRPSAARVTLENPHNEFEFVEAANSIEDEHKSSSSSESRLVNIPPEDGVSVSFLIQPRKLGHIDIRVLAQGEFAGDAIVKKLLVKAEGQVQHFNKAMLLNLSGPQSVVKRNVSIEVPANAVEGSQKVFVAVVGDILGAGLSNVDDLLRLPYGCGEQNMINLVPNIVILNYLQGTKRLRDVQKSRAVRNIETGYQRQLNYKRSDGSFSAFGQNDANGSVWLTAYVLKTFQQAKSIISVDEKIIRRAANFLARFARPDGSIEEVGMLHMKELASAASGRPTYLTAYTIIALLQRPIAPDADSPPPVPLDEVVDRGLAYLERQLEAAADNDESPYELAIITYALHLANRQSTMGAAYDKLWARASHDDDDHVWWSAASRGARGADGEGAPPDPESLLGAPTSAQPAASLPPLKPLPVGNAKQSAHLYLADSLSVEMTALALLTTVKKGELDRALPIVRWLISQQNSQGGFASTQDTVLAIEALAAFAEASTSQNAPLSIDVEFVYPRTGRQRTEIRKTNSDQLLISQTNALVQQRTRLPDNITWVQVQATGAGSAVVQVSWQYNLLVSAERPAFYLNPILDKTSNINYLQLSVCTYYKAGEASNMAVAEIELPSGYVADAEALPGLTRQKSIKRVDTADGETKVLVYLDKVTRDEICFTVPAHRSTKVSNNKPVPVTIYDYYDRKQAARIFYEPQLASSCDICELDSCSESCRRKAKKFDRLVSLHDQRRINLNSGPNQTSTPSNETHGNLSSSNNATLGQTRNEALRLLPLAPVYLTLASTIRGLYAAQH